MSVEGYDFIRELGRGAMGSVHLARQIGLDREVAVKRVLGAASDPGAAAQGLQAEARLLARLNHPHVVRVYELLNAGDDVLMVMEYVPGTDLRRLLAGGPLAPAVALDYVAQLAAALDHAHDQGIVHRDVKPSNVMVRSNGVLKLGDFGVAEIRARRRRGAAGGSPVGTPAYMAPESARGDAAVDRRADVYSLAVVAYELLAGRVPFPVDPTDPRRTLRAQMEEAPPRPGLADPLEAVLMRGLQKRRERRPRSAGEFAAALRSGLERAGGDDPTLAAGPFPAGMTPDVTIDSLDDSTTSPRARPGDAPAPDVTAARPDASVPAGPSPAGMTPDVTIGAPDDSTTSPPARPGGTPAPDVTAARTDASVPAGPSPAGMTPDVTIGSPDDSRTFLPARPGDTLTPDVTVAWPEASVTHPAPGPPPVPTAAPVRPMPPPPVRPVRRPGRRGALALASLAVVAALALAYLGVARLRAPSPPAPAPAPLEVFAVSAAAQPAAAGHCPEAAFTFRGTLTTNGRPGTVTYRWLEPDGEVSPPTTTTLKAGARRATVTPLLFTFRGNGSAHGAATLHVTSPADLSSQPVDVTYACP